MLRARQLPQVPSVRFTRAALATSSRGGRQPAGRPTMPGAGAAARGRPPTGRTAPVGRPLGAAMRGGARGAAAGALGRGGGRFLREEEEDDDLMRDDDEELDDLDIDALPEGTAPTRGANFDEFKEERELEEEQAEEDAIEAALAEDEEEVGRFAPEERAKMKQQESKYSLRTMAALGADKEDIKKLRKIIHGNTKSMRTTQKDEEKSENPEFFDSNDSPAHAAKDQEAVLAAVFSGWLKATRGDKEAFRVEEDPRLMLKAKREFEELVTAGRFSEEELTKFADDHLNDYMANIAEPAMEAAIDARPKELNEVQVERAFATPEEASAYSTAVLSLGNKFVPAQYYVRIKQQEFDAFFPEGVAGTLDKEWLMMANRRSILVREPAIKVSNALEKQRADRFRSGPPAHFIRGAPGTGKSCVLSSVVYWARKNGWLVVWIPSGFNFVNDGNLQRSRREPLHFDQPEVAMPFLEKFGKGNAHIIGQLPLRTSFTIGVPNVVFTSEGKTMLDLVNFAKDSFDYATDAAFYLRHELNLVTEFPVLIAIDDYNLFHDHAVNLYDPDFQKLNPPLINPEKLVLASLFRSWQNHGLTNGTMVVAMTNTKPRSTKPFDAAFPKLPSVFNVERYTREEFLTVVANYEQTGYIHAPATRETYRYVYHMCAGRGSEIYKMLALY